MTTIADLIDGTFPEASRFTSEVVQYELECRAPEEPILGALVFRRPLPGFAIQMDQRAFWWGHSHERAVLIDSQRLQRERSAEAAEQLRMDEVHESRASRHAAKEARA